MAPDTLYPTGCFDTFILPRGRVLSSALAQDPAAPEPHIIDRAKCFSLDQIDAYLQDYGDDFQAISYEINAEASKLRDEFERNEQRRETQTTEAISNLANDQRAVAAAFQRELESFAKEFIAEYSTDISTAFETVIGIYFCRKNGEIIYVGQSRNVYARVAEQKRCKSFDTVHFLPCDQSKLDDLEGFFIRLLRPRLNRHDEGVVHGAPKSAIWDKVITLPYAAITPDG